MPAPQCRLPKDIRLCSKHPDVTPISANAKGERAMIIWFIRETFMCGVGGAHRFSLHIRELEAHFSFMSLLGTM